MRTIRDIMICEAIRERHLRELEQQCKIHKTNFIDITRNMCGVNINWDKLTDDRAFTYDIERSIKIIRALRTEGKQPKEFMSNNVLVLGHRGDEYEFIYYPSWNRMIRFTGDDKFRDPNRSWTSKQAIEVRTDLKATEVFDYFKGCDEIVFLDFTGLTTDEMRRDRSNARAGAWILNGDDHHSRHLTKGVLGKEAGGLKDSWSSGDTYGSFYRMCMDIATQNKNRYKNMLAERKARSIDTTDMDKIVDKAYEISDRCTKLFMNAVKSAKDIASRYSVTSAKTKLQLVNRIFRDLLDAYDTYIAEMIDLGNNQNLYGGTSYARRAVDEMNKYTKLIEAKFEEFKDAALQLEDVCKNIK